MSGYIKMEIQLPQNYFSTQVKLLRFLGIEVETPKPSILYKIYAFFMRLFILIYVGVEVTETFLHKDLLTIVTVGNYSVSHFLGGIKLIVLYNTRLSFGEMFANFHIGLCKPNRKRGGRFEEEVIHYTLKQTRRQFFWYGMTIVGVVSLGYINSMKVRLTRPNDEWAMSYIPFTIFNTTYTPRFEMAHSYQAIGVILISLVVYTIDISIISVIAQLSCQLKILRNSIRNLRKRVNILTNETGEAKRDEHTDTVFRSCLDHHLYIISTTNNVENMCSVLCLCVFLANLLLLCFLMYYTSLLSIGVEIIQYGIYCILVTLQVYMYCSWGNSITLESLAVSDDAAAIFLPQDKKHISMGLLMMIQRSQRPLRLTAGKFAYLSLETFVSVMKGACSYFMFLRKMNTDKEE